MLDGRAALIRSFVQDSRFEFRSANIFTRRVAVTLPVGISKFITEKQILWGYITAAATLATLPPVVLLWFFRDWSSCFTDYQAGQAREGMRREAVGRCP